jgi:cystinosin
MLSGMKYIPQLYWNFKRKSTEGWSIFNIIMDLTGGVCSFGQIGLENAFK